MIIVSHEEAFNQKQQMKFWLKLIKALNISDKYDEYNKLRIRIEHDDLCFQKKLHQVVFQEEMELWT